MKPQCIARNEKYFPSSYVFRMHQHRGSACPSYSRTQDDGKSALIYASTITKAEKENVANKALISTQKDTQEVHIPMDKTGHAVMLNTSKSSEAVPSSSVPRGRTGMFENIPYGHHIYPCALSFSFKFSWLTRLTLEVPVQFLSQNLRTQYYWAPPASQTLSKMFSRTLALVWSHKMTPFKSVHGCTTISTMKSHGISSYFIQMEGFC